MPLLLGLLAGFPGVGTPLDADDDRRLSYMDLMSPWRRVLPLPGTPLDNADKHVFLLLAREPLAAGGGAQSLFEAALTGTATLDAPLVIPNELAAALTGGATVGADLEVGQALFAAAVTGGATVGAAIEVGQDLLEAALTGGATVTGDVSNAIALFEAALTGGATVGPAPLQVGQALLVGATSGTAIVTGTLTNVVRVARPLPFAGRTRRAVWRRVA